MPTTDTPWWKGKGIGRKHWSRAWWNSVEKALEWLPTVRVGIIIQLNPAPHFKKKSLVHCSPWFLVQSFAKWFFFFSSIFLLGYNRNQCRGECSPWALQSFCSLLPVLRSEPKDCMRCLIINGIFSWNICFLWLYISLKNVSVGFQLVLYAINYAPIFLLDIVFMSALLLCFLFQNSWLLI